MNNDFDYRRFHKHRKFLKWLGLFLVLFGLFTILDMMSEVPIPLTGRKALFAGTLLILAGFIALYKGYKLPLQEALELIHNRPRGITESELVHEMLVDRATAKRIINELSQKGFLRVNSSKENISEQVYDIVR